MDGPDKCDEDAQILSAGADSSAAQRDLEAARKDFDIPPATALKLLHLNIEMLVKLAEDQGLPVDRSSVSVSGARRDNVSSGETTPIRVTELHCSPGGYVGAGHDSVQQSVLSKRFVSKREPPINMKDYLQRLHRYCPMSTAVYLAASVYITRMAMVEKVVSVNSRNMHRLVLAGLRVAMKSLEDLSYPHHRVAKVGGVSEGELSKLEISFCFLADFELRVDLQMLLDQVKYLERSKGIGRDSS